VKEPVVDNGGDGGSVTLDHWLVSWRERRMLREENEGRRVRGVRGVVLGAAATAVVVVTACVHGPPGVGGAPGAPPSPHDLWVPPAEARKIAESVPAGAVDTTKLTPQALAAAGQGLTLPQVVDLALSNNPATRASWLQARAAADAYGQARGSLFPTFSASATALTSKQVASNVRFGGTRNQISPSLNLSWLVLDVGGRSGSREAAREATYAAGFHHDAVIQSAVLQAEAAYFGYMATRALLQAQQASVTEADANLQAAQHRHDVGLATIADVLQARTAASQARLALETTQGQLQAARATVAVAMGLPANAPFDVAPPPEQISVGPVSESVDSLIAQAVRSRPDLAAAEASARQAYASARVTRSGGLPTLSLSGNAGRVISDVSQLSGTSYTLSLGLSIPLFTGFAQTYANRAAEARAETADAQAEGLRQQVVQQVFTSYYALQTATQKVHTTDDLLASAEQSEQVAQGRYNEGVGTILDLLTAQQALADARTQQSQARWSWLLALAQLAHDGGVLGINGAAAIPVAPDSTSNRLR
jgi:outer membrane protein